MSTGDTLLFSERDEALLAEAIQRVPYEPSLRASRDLAKKWGD